MKFTSVSIENIYFKVYIYNGIQLTDIKTHAIAI